MELARQVSSHSDKTFSTFLMLLLRSWLVDDCDGTCCKC